MSEVNRILEGILIPKMLLVRQEFEKTCIKKDDIMGIIANLLNNQKFVKNIRPGMNIAITAGSREISNIQTILAATSACLKKLGAHPFIIPAMGSHGGATADGQRAVLASLSINETTCGCPIISSMETVCIGQTHDGQDVFMDRNAKESDGILIVGRVKAHTDFRGRYKSGIMKMMAIGLGKQKGAEKCHLQGFGKIASNVENFGHTVLWNSNVVGAIAIIDNAFDNTYDLVGLAREEIESNEPVLLEKAKNLMPKILLPECDVLIVDEIGKNFSGTGLDPNVVNRHSTPYSSGGLSAQRVAVLGLSEKTHNNGFGIGAADCTTERVVSKLDRQAMYINSLTSRVLSLCNIPCVFANDKLAIQACIKTCLGIEKNGPRIIRIPNTLHLEYIMVSENLKTEIMKNERMQLEGEPLELPFDDDGFLKQFLSNEQVLCKEIIN